VRGLGGAQIVDDIHGKSVEDRVTRDAGGVGQSNRQMGLSKSDAAAEHDAGVRLQEVQPEEMLHLDTINLLGPTPLELFEGLDPGEVGGTNTSLDRLFLSLLDSIRPGAPGNPHGTIVRVRPDRAGIGIGPGSRIA
jgi:hypothetical protein